jgi:hypothetical protein
VAVIFDGAVVLSDRAAVQMELDSVPRYKISQNPVGRIQISVHHDYIG